MQVEIEDKTWKALKDRLPKDSRMRLQVEDEDCGYGYARTIYVDTLGMDNEDLQITAEYAREIGDNSLKNVALGCLNVRSSNDTVVRKLSMVPEILAKWLMDDIIDGWLYHDVGLNIFDPYLIVNVKYEKADKRNDQPAVATIEMVANAASDDESGGRGRRNAQLKANHIRLHEGDVRGKTMEEILLEHGFFKETRELKDHYISSFKRFSKFQAMHGEQFVCRGQAKSANRWSKKDQFSLDGSCRSFKCVNDEDLISRSSVEEHVSHFWLSQDVDSRKIPHHLHLFLYHLDVHEGVWCHVDHLEPYVYDKTLRDKIVLPDSHRDLIETLVTDFDILVDDVIKGKSGGTTVLCYGKPGLGKTLTAEVYCEVIERPLYKVNAGLLGTTPKDVEKELETVLKRAARWRAVLLLDEADVYIRKRGNDIEQNAIVAAFLRVLEYFDGLFFMTTNLGGNTDDAIESRCIARICYDNPSDKDLKRIWEILSTQFNVELDSALIDQLVEWQPGLPGRDVKELLKLTSKYARQKGVAYDIEVFRKMGQFRGLHERPKKEGGTT